VQYVSRREGEAAEQEGLGEEECADGQISLDAHDRGLLSKDIDAQIVKLTGDLRRAMSLQCWRGRTSCKQTHTQLRILN
jgi:hypothetical protein